MASLKKITASVLLAFFMLGAADRANATFPSVDLVANNSVTYDGLTFTVSTCTLASNTATATNCSTAAGAGQANDRLEVVASNRGTPTIEIVGNGSGSTGGTAIAKGSAALACNLCSNTSTLSVRLDVTRAPTTSSTITAFSNAITANAQNSGITSQATYTGTGGGTSTENASTLLSSGTIAVTNALPTTMSFTVTLGLAAYSSGVLALSTDSLHFSPAPEPATIAVFGAGLAGLTAVRRRLKRGTAGQDGSTSIEA